ncbi:hypothetical protein KM043_007968 [Ampulex compressa]|nr:hypothetical protein KM043_007968 [Ampulex compressa]
MTDMISTITKQKDEKKKESKQTVIERYNTDKEMFGPLIKTTEKLSKVTSIQKRVNGIQHSNKKNNSELSWVPASDNEVVPSEDTKASRSDSVNDIPNHNIPILTKCEQGNIQQHIDTSILAQKFEKPPNIVVKNLITFPIATQKNDSIGTKKVPEATDILSIPRIRYTNELRLSSVTNILNQTMSPESRQKLHLWKMKMEEKLGQQGFIQYVADLKSDGNKLHSCIQNSLLMKEFDIPSQIKPAFESVKSVVDEISDVKVIESYVSHSKLKYCGIIDCVATYRGKRYVIDWKKSDRKKDTLGNTYDAPLQVAAYIGAINSCDDYPFSVQNGLVVVVYTSGEPATVLEINPDNVEKYWKKWLRRLQQYFVELK